MALYMLQAKYTSEAIRSIAESGSNREDAARAVIEQCGGKLIGMWGMLGQDYHIALVVEYDDLPSYLGTVITTVLGGAIADFKSIALYSSDDVVKGSGENQANKPSYVPQLRSLLSEISP